jgi:hypothetical protein
MSRCAAPGCRCIAPCDEYYDEVHEPYEVEDPDLDLCPHCDEPQWSYDTLDKYRVCSSCGRGDIIVSRTESRQHVARKAFSRSMETLPGRARWENAAVEPGDVYRRDVMLGYEVNGPRFLVVRRTLIRKADPLERLAAILTEQERT